MLAASIEVGAQDYEGNEWVYPGCVGYTPATIDRFARDAGLEVLCTNWTLSSPYRMFLFFRSEARQIIDNRLAGRGKIVDPHTLVPGAAG